MWRRRRRSAQQADPGAVGNPAKPPSRNNVGMLMQKDAGPGLWPIWSGAPRGLGITLPGACQPHKGRVRRVPPPRNLTWQVMGRRRLRRPPRLDGTQERACPSGPWACGSPQAGTSRTAVEPFSSATYRRPRHIAWTTGITGNAQDAEDVVQGRVLDRGSERSTRFRGESAFWLLALYRIRWRKRGLPEGPRPAEPGVQNCPWTTCCRSFDEQGPTTSPPMGRLVRRAWKTTRSRLNAGGAGPSAINKLPADYRAALLLRDVEGPVAPSRWAEVLSLKRPHCEDSGATRPGCCFLSSPQATGATALTTLGAPISQLQAES